ncbi:22026_t:CDS:1, partial [Gigaspora margarita]
MEEYLLKASFDNKEVDSDFSQESDIDIAIKYYEKAFMFDWQ